MDIQLFATDEELQDFPESKTDSSTVQDKTPSTKSINLMASDLPKSHSDLPISSRLPEHKSKHKSRRDHRRKSRSNTRSKNCIVGHLAAQMNDQLDTKQEIQWVISPKTYLNQLVGHPIVPPPPPSEAALPGQPVLGSLETAPPVAHQPEAHPPMVHPPVARQPVLHPPVVRQPVVCQPVLHQPVVHQPSCTVPLLLSLHLQPDLNALTQTLSPQALRYIHLGIQISQNLLN